MSYDNTKVPTARSQEAIRRMIMANGGTGIAFVSEPPLESFQAHMQIDGKTYTVRIIARLRSREQISSDHHRSGQTHITALCEQEERRVWRVLFYHLKGLFEAAATGVLEFRELILPYIVTKDGRTVAEHILPELAKAIEGRPERLLTTGRKEP